MEVLVLWSEGSPQGKAPDQLTTEHDPINNAEEPRAPNGGRGSRILNQDEDLQPQNRSENKRNRNKKNTKHLFGI